MPRPERRIADNVPGEFYVDDSCINCGTCRFVAPGLFADNGDFSYVSTQPDDEGGALRAMMAAVACPTASIGAMTRKDVAIAGERFPEPITDDVSYLGFADRASYGASSYLIKRPGGNVMIDVPRWSSRLVAKIEAQGGVATMIFTHRDDIGDHEKFARHFKARRVMHADDMVTAASKKMEVKIEGQERVALDPDLTLIPVPGHSKGSICIHYQDEILFTGDHLAWSESRGHLIAFRSACWYDFEIQTESMARLLGLRFHWILPGHGQKKDFDPATCSEAIAKCIAWMRTGEEE